MSRLVSSVFLAVVVLSGTAHALWLVRDGQPTATIVFPSRPPRPRSQDRADPAVTDFLVKSSLHSRVYGAAKDLREHIRAITGAELPLVDDTRQVKGNVVLIGDTKQTWAMGFPKDELAKNYLVIRVRGKALVLRGRKRGAWDGRYPRAYNGARDAVYYFLERVLGVRWFAPGKIGRELPPPTRDLWIDDSTEIRKNPSVLFGGEIGRMPYHSRNRGKPRGLLRVFGGHSWGHMVPPSVYFDKKGHPETYHPKYYPLVHGRRISDAQHGGSLCTESPGALKVAIDYVRRMFDSDLDVVELGQPDSYQDSTACHCPKCMQVGDTSSHGLGARIFKFHLAIAREVLKTHTHKFVLHSLYGPSYHIPESFKGPLPPNFMLEFSGSRGEIFRLMKRYEPLKPAGTTVYLYEFTSYNPLGYGGPKSSVAQIIELFRNIRQHKVKFVYWCGWADNNFGLEAPQYWLAQQLQWDWDQDPQALMNEFWRRYFRRAGGEMKAFYEHLDRRKRETILERYPKKEDRPFKRHFCKLNSYEVYPVFFTDETNAGVAARLGRAMELAKGDDVVLKRIRLAEEAYEFNIITAACFGPHLRFQTSGSLEDLRVLRDAVERRRALLVRLKERFIKGEFRDFCLPYLRPRWWSNEVSRKAVNGHGPFQGPFNLDFDSMIESIRNHPLKKRVVAAVARKPEAGAWAAVKPFRLTDNSGRPQAHFPTEVRVAWDPANLYVRFTCRETMAKFLVTNHGKKRDGPVWRDDDVEVFIGHPEDAAKYHQFLVNAAGVRTDLSRGWPRFDLDPDPMKANMDWNGEWSVDVDTRGAPKMWGVTFAIPFKTLGYAPGPGDTWRVNFGRFRPRKAPTDPKEGYILSWNPTFGQFGTTGRFGMITFAK